MIVRVGWIGVPLADRSTCGWFFLGAASVEGTAAEARATVATTKAKARIAPHFLELQHSRVPCRAIAEAKRVDEVKDIRNKATVMEASAYQRHAPPHTGTRRGVPPSRQVPASRPLAIPYRGSGALAGGTEGAR
jgi:hypothetical protein